MKIAYRNKQLCTVGTSNFEQRVEGSRVYSGYHTDFVARSGIL